MPRALKAPCSLPIGYGGFGRPLGLWWFREDWVIQLTRLNNEPLTVNSDLIKFVESAHDTVLTLINGEKIVVRERVEQVIERVIQFRRAILSGLPMMMGEPMAAAVSSKTDVRSAPQLKEGAGRG